jgi:hypothetical protein
MNRIPRRIPPLAPADAQDGRSGFAPRPDTAFRPVGGPPLSWFPQPSGAQCHAPPQLPTAHAVHVALTAADRDVMPMGTAPPPAEPFLAAEENTYINFRKPL